MGKVMSNSKRVIFVIVLLFIALGQYYIDIYLPAFPEIQRDFGTTHDMVQYTLSIYLLTLGLSQLIYGELADSYGRKKPLIIGFILSIVGTVFSIFSNSVDMLIISRAVQGCGLGAMVAVGVPICVDIFKDKELLIAFLYLTLAVSLPPIIAPFIGGTILLWFSWKIIFILLLILNIVILCFILFWLPETNMRPTGDFSVKKLSKNILFVVSHYEFICATLVMVFAWSIIIIFNVLGPFLFQLKFNFSPYQYGIITLILGFSYFSAILLNRFLVKYYSSLTLTIISVLTGLSVGVIFFLIELFIGCSPLFVVIFVFLLIFPTGVLYSNCMAISLEKFKDNSGIAIAVQQLIQLVGWSAITVILSMCGYSIIILSSACLIVAGLGVVFLCLYLYKIKYKI